MQRLEVSMGGEFGKYGDSKRKQRLRKTCLSPPGPQQRRGTIGDDGNKLTYLNRIKGSKCFPSLLSYVKENDLKKTFILKLLVHSMAIYFYSTTDKYGYLTNFSRHGFHLDGKHWPTVEHYFQAQKFSGTEFEERVRRATTPREAKRLGNDRSMPLRPDWGQVKDDVMKRAIMRKFEAHDKIRSLLLGTGDEELVEDAPQDYYWGRGADGTGKNMLGKILMEVRSSFRMNRH